jgi:hypothetical protein
VELASTLAKNATETNPFRIIPLQTTRKENNWKTEETLAGAVVTLETERITGMFMMMMMTNNRKLSLNVNTVHKDIL